MDPRRRFLEHLIPWQDLYLSKPEKSTNWREQAACIGYGSIFLADFSHKQIAEARKNEIKTQKICMACPVRAHCLWDALEVPSEKFFMRGGASPEQLKKLRRKLRLKEEEAA